MPLLHTTSRLTEHLGDDAYATLDGYRAKGGYEAARRAMEQLAPSDIIAKVEASGLQGRGGAGFPTGRKWSFMPVDSAGPSLLVCNADESEPGSFKDRLLLERAPHLVLEGILIAARAVRAATTFLYLRGEYAEAAAVMQRAIDDARAAGLLGSDVFGTGIAHDVVLHRGAGAYICGEETALLESLEGKKGLPRVKPPYPAECGAFGLPTTVNNVETLCHVVGIVDRGPEWFRELGTEESPGTTLFGVSGHVVRPGLYELPLGTPLHAIVFEHAGGVPDGHKVKGVIPGGISTPILPAGQLDVAMANESLRSRGSFLGTAGIIVLDDTTCMVRAGQVISGFFRDESCGQCTQCREGTGWIHKIVARIERGAGRESDLVILADAARRMEGHTICAFADAAAWPIQGLLRHFRAEFEEHVRGGKCPLAGGFVP